MSRWTIRLPVRHRDESLGEVGANARGLPAEERDTVRALLNAAAMDGIHDAGRLLDVLGALSPEQRRAALDDARREAGLPSTSDVELRDSLRAMRSPSPTPPKCAEPCCNQWSTTHPDVRRWYCPAHAHLATAGDLAAVEVRMEITASGALREISDVDDERESRERAQREAREQERRLDADEHAAELRAERDRDGRTDAEAQRRRALAHYADLIDREPSV